MKVERIDTENLEATLKVTIEPSDYLGRFNEEFKKVKGKVSLKGFRKGKTPDRVIKRMYGNPILIEVMEKVFQESLNKYIDENKIQYVCQPLPTKEQDLIKPDINNAKKEYTFAYDLGLLPDFKIQGISPEDSYNYFVADISEETIQKQMDGFAMSLGGMETVDDEIKEGDKLTLSAVEIDDDGKKVDKGWETTFDINYNILDDDQLKKEILGNKTGHTFNFDMSKLTDVDEEMVKKNYLQVEEGDDRIIGDSFTFKIEEFARMVPKELNDEVVKEALGSNGLESVEALKERVTTNISNDLKGITDSLLYTKLMERIREDTKIDLPHGFVKRWLKETEKLEDDKLEEMYDSFVSDLEWSVIRRKLEEDYNVEVTREEMGEYFHQKAQEFMAQIGYHDQSIFKTVVERMSSDQNEVYKASNAISTNKIFKQIGEIIVKVEHQIGEDELRAKLQNNQKPVAPLDEEE